MVKTRSKKVQKLNPDQNENGSPSDEKKVSEEKKEESDSQKTPKKQAAVEKVEKKKSKTQKKKIMEEREQKSVIDTSTGSDSATTSNTENTDNNNEKKESPKKEPDPKIVTGITKGGALVDVHVPNSSNYSVAFDKNRNFNGKYLDATLNCSDLGKNNNKFYIIQVLQNDTLPNSYHVWNRWGRVGVTGQSNLSCSMGFDNAARDFMSKYRNKTSSKYTMIEIDYSKKEDEKMDIDKTDKADEDEEIKLEESKLHKKVQELIGLIYNTNIMKQQMIEIGYDANKMPLGKLGAKTLKDGYNVLKSIETEIKGNKNQNILKKLSSDFYTLIPHNFGFK